MLFPPNIIANGKSQLQALWGDTVTITRKQRTRNVMEDVVMYSNIKCHFSQSSQPVLNQSDTVATTNSVFTLYVDTAVEIMAGDNLIIRHKKQTFEGVAGQPFHRNFSNVVKVEVKKIS